MKAVPDCCSSQVNFHCLFSTLNATINGFFFTSCCRCFLLFYRPLTFPRLFSQVNIGWLHIYCYICLWTSFLGLKGLVLFIKPIAMLMFITPAYQPGIFRPPLIFTLFLMSTHFLICSSLGLTHAVQWSSHVNIGLSRTEGFFDVAYLISLKIL